MRRFWNSLQGQHGTNSDRPSFGSKPEENRMGLPTRMPSGMSASHGKDGTSKPSPKCWDLTRGLILPRHIGAKRRLCSLIAPSHAIAHIIISYVHMPFGNTTSSRLVYVSRLPELRGFISWASEEDLRWNGRNAGCERKYLISSYCSAIVWSCRNPTRSKSPGCNHIPV